MNWPKVVTNLWEALCNLARLTPINRGRYESRYINI